SMPIASCYYNEPTTTVLNILSLHDALPIFAAQHFQHTAAHGAEAQDRDFCHRSVRSFPALRLRRAHTPWRISTTVRWRRSFWSRSEEHTSELQSRFDIVCRLLLGKKKKEKY